MEVDAVLVERAQANDRGAFGKLYERYYGRIFRQCENILKNTAAAEDVTQDTFLRAYRKIGSFRGTAAFSTWLQRIAIHNAIQKLRRSSYHCEISSEMLDFMPQFGKRDRTLELSPEWRELTEALKKLSPKHQRILYLRVMGYQYPEIAAMLGCDIPCCKSRYRMAVIYLRRILARPISFRA